MAFVFSDSASNYLSSNSNSYIPDFTGDVSIFIQAREDIVSTGSEYKTVLLFNDGGTPYDIDYLWLGFSKLGDDQVIELGSGSDIVTSVITLNQWIKFGIGILYESGTTTISLIVGGVLVDSFVKDLSGILQANTYTFLGGDNQGGNSKSGLAINYFRVWNGRLLTPTEFIYESYSPNAVKKNNLTCDTLLEVVNTAIQNLLGGPALDLNGTATTELPGPLGSFGFKYVGIAEQEQIFYYDFRLVLIAYTEKSTSLERFRKACTARDGTVWTISVISTTYSLKQFNPSTGILLQTIPVAIPIGTVTSGSQGSSRCLFELVDGSLLTINNNTNDVVKIAIPSGSITILGLNLPDGLDGCLNDTGDRLIYVDDDRYLRVYDPLNDVSLCTIKDYGNHPGSYIVCPVWLTDCNVIIIHWDNDSNTFSVDKLTTAGNLLQTYNFDQALVGEGVYGIQADLQYNQLIIFLDNSDPQISSPAFCIIDLTTGVTTFVLHSVVIDYDYDDYSAFERAYDIIDCTACRSSRSGLYYLVRNKRNDTLYTGTGEETEDVKIPNIHAQTYFVGDE